MRDSRRGPARIVRGQVIGVSGEPYAAICASLPWHRKVRAIPDQERLAAFGLYTAVCAYSQALRTDGFIAHQQLAAVFPCPEEERTRCSSALIRVGLFDEADGGIQVHDYLEHNKSREQIEQLGGQRATAGRRGGVASGKARGSKGSKQLLEATPEQSSEEIAVKRSDEPSGAEEQDPYAHVARKAPDPECDLCSGSGIDKDEPCWCTTQ